MPSRLSDVFETHPVFQHHHNQNLDLNSLQHLPDSHAWASELTNCSLNPGINGQFNLPVIDLNDPINGPKHVVHACKTWGAFQIINHGVPKQVIDNMEAAAKKLFSLPYEHKLKAERCDNGAVGYGPIRISSFFPKRMWSEGFTIVGSPVQHARKLWPDDYTSFCDVTKEYQKEMKKLAGKLMWIMLESLGITKEDIAWAGPDGEFDDSGGVLQLNSYPVCPDPGRAIGIADHTDSSLLTILHQSNQSGLQVFREEIGWVSVPPIEGALVVNIGDLLHILSNGLYPSVLHRVVVNRDQHRLSMAYLYGPPNNVEISPLLKLVDRYHPPLYRPVTWTEYLGMKAKLFYEALSALRLSAPASC
ncbi:gibberellin 3-beta-dioxygenase 1-like [Apium graveolens]|uniref:gibberellin 3-beta-dioxygenase 1-like n=1 Tax=Apium graveolens TaxID=4045 RepID=UPI003D7BFB85